MLCFRDSKGKPKAGVPKDAAKAIGWLTRAANNDGKRLQNEDEAGVVALDQWALSTLYFEGKVTAQNDDLAYYWLALAQDNVEGDVSTESPSGQD